MRLIIINFYNLWPNYVYISFDRYNLIIGSEIGKTKWKNGENERNLKIRDQSANIQ